MKKALFLDRDGTINKMVKKYGGSYNKIIEDTPFSLQELVFNDGIKELADGAKKIGYKLIIVTNQPSIIKGESSLKDYEEITKKICEFLKIDRSSIFECFHKEGYSLECNCRKPSPGLFLMAKGMHDIDLKKSVMIGDSWKDIKAAKTAGIGKTIFLWRMENKNQFGNREDEEKMRELKILPDFFADDLMEVHKILKNI
jgi:D-glycero-D-manno-heptose 1,7-bisphosphate phosphatase